MASNSEDQAEMVVDLMSPLSSVDDSSKDRNAVQEGTDFIASFPAFTPSSLVTHSLHTVNVIKTG